MNEGFEMMICFVNCNNKKGEFIKNNTYILIMNVIVDCKENPLQIWK